MVTLRFNTDNKTWDIIETDKQEDDIQLPNFLIEKLDKVKKDLKDDKDVVAICVGDVGAGKSTLMRLCCRYVSDEKFNPRKHIIQDVDDIGPIMKDANQGDSILIDESSGIFGSTDTLTKKTKYANLVLDVCRQKNLFIALCAPYYHRLGASVAIDRSKFLLRVYYHRKNGKRGYMCYYSEKRKEKLFKESKKNNDLIRTIKPNWRGTFGVDKTHEELYKKVKGETLNKVLDSFGTNKTKVKSEAEILRDLKKELIKKHWKKKAKELGEMLGMSERGIFKIKAEIRDESPEFRKETNPFLYKQKMNDDFVPKYIFT